MIKFKCDGLNYIQNLNSKKSKKTTNHNDIFQINKTKRPKKRKQKQK